MSRWLSISQRLNIALIIIITVLMINQWLTWQELQQYKSNTVAGNPIDAYDLSVSNETECRATVKVRWLNQRSGPGQSYDILGSVRQGEVVTGIAWDQSQQWLLVETDDSSVWMYAAYMSLSNCDELPVSQATIEQPSTSEVAASIPESGTQIEAQSENSRRRPGQNPADSTSSSAALVTATPAPTNVTQTPSSGTVSASMLSSIFTAEVQYWAEEIMIWAAAYELDPNLIATVIQIESCGDPTISSSAGAQGLFQVMPFHFDAGEDMLEVQTNAQRGLEYLKGALTRAEGNVGLALVGYNGGYAAMNGGWALETQHYYYWGSGIYAEATSGAVSSSTLDEWLTAGGSTLCAQASESLQLG